MHWSTTIETFSLRSAWRWKPKAIRPDTYTDGVAALQGIQDNPPDMAIFDIKMPRMDGMELLRRLRQKTDLPVIFLTSKDDEIDELFGLKMGADDFIRKPFSQRLLVERVKAVLRRAVPKDGTAPPIELNKTIERGKLVMDPDRHSCTWEDKPGNPDGHRVPDSAVARPAPRHRKKPRRTDGCSL